MRQQINLYQPIFNRERKQFSAATAGAILAAVVVALTGFSVHARLRVDALEREVNVLREQQVQQEALVAQNGTLLAGRGSAADVEARIKTLAGTLAERKRALTVLQSGAAGQASGFAPRLAALARRHVQGLWIDTLVISGTTGAMALGGGSVNPDVVPAYLRSLSHEPVLSGTRFDDFVIEQPAATAADDQGADEVAPARKDAPTVKHVRFRAGNKALAPPRPGSAP